MTITSIEEFNLQGFQGDQISYRHGNGKPTNLSLGKYSKLLAVTFYIYLYVKWALLSGCSVQTAPHSLFPVLRCQILDAITPVCILEVRGNSDRKSQWKQTQKWVVFAGKKNNNLTNTCGSEAISHTAVQDPRVSVPCIMKLQLNVFCSVWTTQFSSNELVCLLYQYLPMLSHKKKWRY